MKKISKRLVQAIRESTATPKDVIRESYLYAFASNVVIGAQREEADFFEDLQDICYKNAKLNSGTSTLAIAKEEIIEHPDLGIPYISLAKIDDFKGLAESPELVLTEFEKRMYPISETAFSELLYKPKISEEGYSGGFLQYAFDRHNQSLFLYPDVREKLVLIYKPLFLCPESIDTPFEDEVSNDYLFCLPFLLAKEISMTVGNNSWTGEFERELQSLIQKAVTKDTTQLNFSRKNQKQIIFR